MDHRYYYSTALGHRHSLPMVVKRKPGSAPAATASMSAAVEEEDVFALTCGGARDGPPRES